MLASRISGLRSVQIVGWLLFIPSMLLAGVSLFQTVIVWSLFPSGRMPSVDGRDIMQDWLLDYFPWVLLGLTAWWLVLAWAATALRRRRVWARTFWSVVSVVVIVLSLSIFVYFVVVTDDHFIELAFLTIVFCMLAGGLLLWLNLPAVKRQFVIAV